MSKIKKIDKIEKEIEELIKKYQLQNKLTLEMIKQWILEEGGPGMESVNIFNKRVLSYFKEAQELKDMNNILQVFVRAWNYFPHNSLGGKSPEQMAKKLYGPDWMAPNSAREKKQMPDVIVGGQKMSWQEHQAMLKEMHKAQKPFKTWIDNDALPSYLAYLKELKLKEDSVEKYYAVAEHFFNRALWLGFVNFEHIRKEFAKYEFPKWWQTHVLGIDIDENQVWRCLKYFFEFLEKKFNIDLSRFS